MTAGKAEYDRSYFVLFPKAPALSIINNTCTAAPRKVAYNNRSIISAEKRRREFSAMCHAACHGARRSKHRHVLVTTSFHVIDTF